MAHNMTDGRPCGLRDEHNGQHRSVEGIERKLAQQRARYATDPWRGLRQTQRQRERRARATEARLLDQHGDDVGAEDLRLVPLA